MWQVLVAGKEPDEDLGSWEEGGGGRRRRSGPSDEDTWPRGNGRIESLRLAQGQALEREKTANRV